MADVKRSHILAWVTGRAIDVHRLAVEVEALDGGERRA